MIETTQGIQKEAIRPPSRKTIVTTQGALTIRAMTRREARDLMRLARGTADLTDTAAVIEAEEKIAAIQAACVVDGAEKLDDIEAGEWSELGEAIAELSREYKAKN